VARDEIWVIAEVRDGVLTRATLQTLAVARSLSAGRDLPVVAVLPGHRPEIAAALAALSSRVLAVGDEAQAGPDPAVLAQALHDLMGIRQPPAVILAPASATGLEVMPRLAAACGGAYAASCVGLRWEAGELAVRRPVYGGKVYEESALSRRPAVVTVRPGSFDAAAPDGAPGEVERVDVPVAPARIRVLERRAAVDGGVDLSDAARVVAGGRGVSGEAYGLVEELATALGGAAAASRALVDAGERPHAQQVGKSGRTVSPELYVACGVSGAIHHVLGMNTAKVVVAINSDPDAPIFQAADYGVVGDARVVLPALTAAIRALTG